MTNYFDADEFYRDHEIACMLENGEIDKLRIEQEQYRLFDKSENDVYTFYAEVSRDQYCYPVVDLDSPFDHCEPDDHLINLETILSVLTAFNLDDLMISDIETFPEPVDPTDQNMKWLPRQIDDWIKEAIYLKAQRRLELRKFWESM